jgi:hypothetical protein
MVAMLSACSQRRLNFYWLVGGSKGYQDSFKARLYERKLDYSIPPGDRPSPFLLYQGKPLIHSLERRQGLKG